MYHSIQQIIVEVHPNPSDDDSMHAKKLTLMGVRAPFSFEKEKELFFLKVKMQKTRIEALIDLGS